MADCPICDFPLVWSEDHHKHWCSVYGDHRRTFEGRNVVIGARVGNGVIRVDFERREAV